MKDGRGLLLWGDMTTQSGAAEAERELGIGIGELEPMPNAEEPETATAEVVEPAPQPAPEGAGPLADAPTGDVKPMAEAVKPDATPNPEMVALHLEMARLRQDAAERNQREVAANDASRVAAYKAALEAKGYDPEVVQEFVAAAVNNIALQRQLGANQERARQALSTQRNNERARIIVTRKFAEEYGVPINTLFSIDTDDPEVVLSAAKLYKSEAALKQLQEARLKPQRMTGVTGNAVNNPGKAKLTERLLNGEFSALTLQEKKTLWPDRY